MDGADDGPPAIAVASPVVAHGAASTSAVANPSEEPSALSKKQQKKLRRAAERAGGDQRDAKKRKSKHDAKFATPKPKYSFDRGYRMVEPYVYEFRTFAKERWFGRELLEIFTTEFGANSPEYYQFAIASGRITVNQKIVPPATILKNGDLIVHKAHRHEPPVAGDEIPVVYEDELMLVVSKPSSIPTHPCGAYRQNSLHSIVQAMRPDLPQLHIVHRLDRLTSGVVIFAKTPAKAKALSLCIADRVASKTYLARVRGSFPAQIDDKIEKHIQETAHAKCSASIITFEHDDVNSTTRVRINCPLRCLSARDGVWECHQEGKPSETVVKLLHSPDEMTSVVECRPVTGRTHQIRLHLQLVGFPIANDPCYGGELHYGESAERLAEISAAKQANGGNGSDILGSEGNEEGDNVCELLASKKPVDLSTPRQESESEEDFMKRTCSWCRVGEAEAFNETQLHCARIWLHALEYKLDGHVFTTPSPTWAEMHDSN